MHGVRRLLWSLTILTTLGCQSMSSESPGLARRLSDALKAPAAQAAEGGGLAALIASRRTSRSEQTGQESLKLPGRWAEDEVLQMVVEQELADATPQERALLKRRLALASEDEVADLLTERRRAKQSAASAQPGATADQSGAASVQPIILTAQAGAESVQQQPAATSAAGHSSQRSEDVGRTYPMATGPARLAAPEPGGGRREPAKESGPISPVAQEVLRPVEVRDAFGAGAESRAAQQEIAETSRIGMADRGAMAEPDTQAEAIARDLDSERAAQSVYWQEDLDKLITLLEAQIAQQKPGHTDDSRDQYVRQHVALRMLYLIGNRRPEAMQAIPGVAHDRQEFWTRMFWALSSIFDEEAMPNSTVRAAETVAQLRAAIEQLQPRASLELRGTVFCRQIDGFGDFVAFGDEPFSAGQPILIYTEVRNFHSEPNEDGSYNTVLQSTITIQQGNVSGPVAFRYDLPESPDRCQSRRQDYFHSYRIHLPETLKPGPHVLTLDVTDALTGKKGSTTLNFIVR